MKSHSPDFWAVSVFRLLLAVTAFALLLCQSRTAPGVVAQVEVQTSSIQKLLEASRAAYARSDFQAAEDFAQAVIAADPANASAYYELARIFDSRQQIPAAFEAIRRSLELDPELAAAWRLLGYLHLNQGQWAKAVAAGERAIEFDADDVAAQVNLGYALYRLGQTDRAYYHFQKALAIAPQHKQALLYSGLLLTDMRRIPEARGRFDQAEGLYPGDAEVQFRLGAFLAAEALPQSAGTDFRNDPSTKEATWRSIYDKAVRHLERSVSLQSDQAEAHRVLLYLHLRAGEYALAIQSGQRTLAKDSRDAASRYNLGLAYYYSRQYAQARTHFQEVLRAHPNTEYARLFFANACMRLGDLDVAIENFNRVLEQNSANSEAHVNLWRIYSARGESDAARTHQARACATGVPEACQDCEGCDERARPD